MRIRTRVTVAAILVALSSCSSSPVEVKDDTPNWSDWAPGDLHVHPMGHGDVEVPDVAGFAAATQRLGFKWWFVTDHGPYMGCPAKHAKGSLTCIALKQYDAAVGARRWEQSRVAAATESRARNMFIMMGEEIGNSAVILGERKLNGGFGHFVALQIPRYLSAPMPPPLECDAAECIERVAATGPDSFGIIAHPSRSGSDWRDLEHVFERFARPAPLAGFELLDGDHHATKRDRQIWDAEILTGHKVWAFGVGEMHYNDLNGNVDWGLRGRTYAYVPGLPDVPAAYDAIGGGQEVKAAIKAGRLVASNGPVAIVRVNGADIGSVTGMRPGKAKIEVFWKTKLSPALHEILPVRLSIVFKTATADGTPADHSFDIDLDDSTQKQGRWSGTLDVPEGFARGLVRVEAHSNEQLPVDKDLLQGNFEFTQTRTAYTNPVLIAPPSALGSKQVTEPVAYRDTEVSDRPRRIASVVSV